MEYVIKPQRFPAFLTIGYVTLRNILIGIEIVIFNKSILIKRTYPEEIKETHDVTIVKTKDYLILKRMKEVSSFS